MDKKKTCMILSAILVILSFVSSFMAENISLIVGIVMLILSIVILIVAANYSKEYKNNYDKNPNGFGIITFGAIFNIVCGILFRAFNSIGTIFILIGTIMMLFNKKND